jgi:hypothetical protein
MSTYLFYLPVNVSLSKHCLPVFTCVTQVFQTFIDGFGVYGPLLSRIKQTFDSAVEAGLQDALSNCELRQQLLEARQSQATAVKAAQADIVNGEGAAMPACRGLRRDKSSQIES